VAGLKLRVVPNAKRSEVVGEHGDAVKVKVAAPALDGKANDALREFLSEKLGVPLRAVRLIAGQKSRDKVITVEGIELEAMRARLLAAL
jgi:uncharacterized protein